MHLFEATEDFKIVGQPKPGFPILLWKDLTSCREVNAFFRYYLLRGAISSGGSWMTIGRALYDFFGFLEAHDLDWFDVGRGERKNLVAAYRDYCLETVKHERNTVRNRLTYICAFYEDALNRGLIPCLPYEFETRHIATTPGYLVHVDASGGDTSVRSVMPTKHRHLPKFLTKASMYALLGATTNPHHLMMLRLALQTGLRREEIATFPLAYLVDAKSAQIGERNLKITLNANDGTGMQTKGSRRRTLIMSRRLMQDLQNYVKHFRGERSSLSKDSYPCLFLTASGLPWAEDGKGFEKIVRRLGQKVGVETCPHMLRHTYATHTLHALQKDRGDTKLEPLVFIQRQLGHASIHQTLVYTHLVDELTDQAVLRYDDELNDWARGAN